MKKKSKTNSKKVTKKTSNRGRPAKLFVSKKSKIKRDGPGRPKKEEKIILPEIPEKKENKTKDGIILILFIISFLVFGFSIYINQKGNISNRIDKNYTTGIPNTGTVTENKSDLNNDTGTNQETTSDTTAILLKFYGYIQSGNIDQMYPYVDINLKKSSTFRTYFSETRLKRFITNIDNQKITINIISQEQNYSKINYNINYSINNSSFIEEREAIFVTKNNEQKIAKIMCKTPGCSKMPFFNPKKYF